MARGFRRARVLVATETIATLERIGAAGRRLFVAGCAERMAQMFTGIRGAQDWRSQDGDAFVAGLDELWSGRPADACEPLLRKVERFEEFDALSCVVHDDPTFAVKCGHVTLTAMGQMDRADPSNLFDEERRFQTGHDAIAGSGTDPEEFRRTCRQSARQRFGILLSRL